MIAQSRKEFLEVLMLDDFVARREALEHWEAKWVATLELVHVVPVGDIQELNRQFPGKADLVARSGLTAKMVGGAGGRRLPRHRVSEAPVA